jgi:STAS domain-containing protein
MRTDHKLNGWPTPPGRAPGASVAPAASFDDRCNNDNSEPDHAFRVHAENGWVVVELPGYPPFPEERTARVLREQLYRLVDSRPVQLQLDLGRVHHASSFLVTTLVSLHHRIRDMGDRLVLRNVDPHLQHMIQARTLAHILEDCSD